MRMYAQIDIRKGPSQYRSVTDPFKKRIARTEDGGRITYLRLERMVYTFEPSPVRPPPGRLLLPRLAHFRPLPAHLPHQRFRRDAVRELLCKVAFVFFDEKGARLGGNAAFLPASLHLRVP